MRASWKGNLRLGALAVPVSLYSGTQSDVPEFVRLHAKDKSPVSRTYVCQAEKAEIAYADTVRAVEHEGSYVEITDAELRGTGSAPKSIIIRQFSDPAAIEPPYYDKPYYIVPSHGGELAYTVLRDAFVRTGKVAIVTYLFYEKEHLGIVAATDGLLVLQQLRFASQIVVPSTIRTPSLPQPSPKQIDIAVEIMQRFSTPFYLRDYRNEQADHLNDLIERKAKHLPAKRPPRVTPGATPDEEILPTLQSLLASQANEHVLRAM